MSEVPLYPSYGIAYRVDIGWFLDKVTNLLSRFWIWLLNACVFGWIADIAHARYQQTTFFQLS